MSDIKTVRTVFAALWGWIVLAVPLPAMAHAIIVKAEPAAGSIVAGPKVVVQLQYNSRIDARRSRVAIVMPDGKEQMLSLLPQPALDSLAAEADHLAPGAYRLHWQVLSVDGHISRGDIPFRVTAP